MWFWIIVIAVVIGGIVGALNSNGDSGESAASGALAGGCLAAGCLGRIAIAAISILLVLWLFGALFG